MHGRCEPAVRVATDLLWSEKSQARWSKESKRILRGKTLVFPATSMKPSSPRMMIQIDDNDNSSSTFNHFGDSARHLVSSEFLFVVAVSLGGSLNWRKRPPKVVGRRRFAIFNCHEGGAPLTFVVDLLALPHTNEVVIATNLDQ